MESLARYLSKARLTQADLARLVGVTQPTVWEWINGHSKPSASRLVKLSRVTGISIDELLRKRPAA